MSMTKVTRILLVDDHIIMREGLQELLERTGEYVIVGQAGDGDVALELAERLDPDVIIMDIMMPVKNGIEACRDIRDQLPKIRVLMLTASTEEDAVIESVAAGATGFLQKFTDKEKLLDTIRDVSVGEFRMPGDVMRRVFEGIRTSALQGDADEQNILTPREQEILALFAQGQSYAEIATAKGNRPLTIRNAIYGIQNKLRVKSKQELVVWAVRNGLLDKYAESA